MFIEEQYSRGLIDIFREQGAWRLALNNFSAGVGLVIFLEKQEEKLTD